MKNKGGGMREERGTPLEPNAALAALVRAVGQSTKYRHVAPAVVAAIGARELAARHNLAEAIKATKNKLHQVGAAYLAAKMPYPQWLALLQDAAGRGGEALRATCAQIMAHHASSRERLPLLESFYTQTLGALGPLTSVADLACGLNPLAIPWMPLAPGAHYAAYDIYLDLMTFLQGALSLLGVQGKAEARDLLHNPPTELVQVALLLKAIPCLEQLDQDAGRKLLAAIPAQHLLVSFPAHSLGGREKGMVAHYEAHFRDLLRALPWRVEERLLFPGELVFLLSR